MTRVSISFHVAVSQSLIDALLPPATAEIEPPRSNCICHTSEGGASKVAIVALVSVGTPPSGKHVARISQRHVARVISRTIIIRIPLRIRMMQFSYPDRLKERQMTFQLLLSKEEQTTLAEHRHPDNLHNASAPQYIRIISMCRPDIIVRMIN